MEWESKEAELVAALENLPGGKTDHRACMIAGVLAAARKEDLAKMRLETCADEETGRRYGLAKKRIGRCRKIGSGGRRHGCRAYQLWLVWA